MRIILIYPFWRYRFLNKNTAKLFVKFNILYGLKMDGISYIDNVPRSILEMR